MDISTIIALVVILAADVAFFLRERKYTLKFKGRNKFGAAMPALILIIIALVVFFRSSTSAARDLIILVPMIPLVFLGNKCGVTEEGVLFNCYLTTWDKIEQFSIGKSNDKKYMLQYKSSIGIRRVYFNAETGEEVDKFLTGMRKIRHRRVN